MKKILSIIVLVTLFVASFNCNAQKIGGSYTSFGLTYKTFMRFNWAGGDATQCVINLKCYDGINWDTAELYVKPGKEMSIFREYLLQISNKFIQWEKIAIENNVRDFEIGFPIDYPGNLTIMWDEHISSIDFKLNFVVDKKGECSVSGNSLMTDLLNKHFKAMWYIDFNDVNEISSLYEATNEENYWEERDLKRSYVPLFE